MAIWKVETAFGSIHKHWDRHGRQMASERHMIRGSDRIWYVETPVEADAARTAINLAKKNTPDYAPDECYIIHIEGLKVVRGDDF